MRDVLRDPVTEPSAWKGTQFQSEDSFVERLTPQEIDEAGQAVRKICEKGLTAFSFEKKDFDAPAFIKRLEQAAIEIEHGRGFVILRGLPGEQYTREEIYIVTWAVGKILGEPLSQNARGDLIGEVTDVGSDYENDMNARGYLSRAELPWHCDYADCSGLVCVNPAKSGGGLLLASSMTVYNTILKEHPEYIDILNRGFPWDLRGEGVTGTLEEVTYHDIPVYSYYKDRLSCSFNGRRIKSARPKIGTALSDVELAAVDSMYEIASREENQLYLNIQAGDIQLLNNHMIFHARSKYVDHKDPAKKRLQLRLWLSLAKGRELAPEFIDRYNTGPKMGVTASEAGQKLQEKTLRLDHV